MVRTANTMLATRHLVIRALAAVLTTGAGAVRASLSLVRDPGPFLRAVQSRKVIWPWLKQSYKLLLGTLAYNVFVLVLVQPLLRRWFPPLNPWEHVKGVFSGSTRITFEELVPVVGTTLWILGNGLIFALFRNQPRDVQTTMAEGSAMVQLDSRSRAGR